MSTVWRSRRFGSCVVAVLLLAAGAACGTRQSHQAAQSSDAQQFGPGAGQTAAVTPQPTDVGSAPAAGGAGGLSETTSPAAQGGPSSGVANAKVSTTPGANTPAQSAAPPGSKQGTSANAPASNSPASPSARKGSASNAPVPGAGSASPGPAPIGPAPGAGGGPVAIGNVGTYSGPAGNSLRGFGEGVQVWARWINDHGGINGAPVKLYKIDDGGDPARHRAAVQDLVENKGVVAIVGNGDAISGGATVSYHNAKRVPAIGGDTGSDWAYDSPMYFPAGPTGKMSWVSMLPSMAQVALPKGYKKLGSMSCAEAQTCGTADKIFNEDGIAQQYGFEPVYRARISLAQPDFTAECLNAQRSGVQALMLATDDSSIQRIAASCARQGYHPMFAWQYSAANDRHKDDPNLEGGMTASGWFAWMKGDTPATAEFQAAAKQYFGGTLSSGLAGGWLAGKIFEKAASKTPRPDTSAGILAGLWTFSGETLGGLAMPLSFHQDQPPPRVVCWGAIVIHNHQFDPSEGGALKCK
jgi:branched-chain amino acid transport system substrate-binding protein